MKIRMNSSQGSILDLLGEGYTDSRHKFLAYGMGVDSTAIIVGWVQRGIVPDAILFADIGAEKQATYDYLPVINRYLRANGYPEVTVVKYEPMFAPYKTLEGNMVMNATLPGATFGKASCTMKFKIGPQDKWVKQREDQYPSRILKAIGFDATEDYRKLRASDKAHAGGADKYDYEYPLIEWGWDRDECKRQIAAAGLPVPEKSACIFCPNTKPEELQAMTDDERGRIVRVEVTAEPYNKKVKGLWRKTRKADGRPGSMTEYMIQQGMTFTHPADLDPMPLNPNCAKSRVGYTFKPPHRQESLAELVDGYMVARPELENAIHAALIESL